MPETPDFEAIARSMFMPIDSDDEERRQLKAKVVADIAEQLRLVWNARPVPRCDQCRFWGKLDRHQGSPFGDCSLSDSGQSLDKARSMVAVAATQEAILETRADFGCVQWEVKP